MSYTYVASPYSDEFPDVRERRYLETELFVYAAVSNGIKVYSPIIHFHNLAERYELPTDNDFWKEFNISMLEKAERVFALRIEGFAASEGVAFELAEATARGKPIVHWYHNPSRKEWTNNKSKDLPYR